MNSSLPKITRKDKLRGWMAANRMTYAFIGAQLGISNVAAHKCLMREFTGARRVAELRALGIPETLLPRPLKK